MSTTTLNPKQAENFATAEFGHPSAWRDFTLDHPRRGKVQGKAFLGRILGLKGMEVSFGAMEPGESAPFLHAHKQNEELYVFLDGQGEMQVDGERIPVQPGTVVRVAPAGLRAWRATGTAQLRYLVIQAKEGSLEQATATDGIISERPLTW